MADYNHRLKHLQIFCFACWLLATGYGLFLLQPAQPMVLVLGLGPAIAVAAWLAADTLATPGLPTSSTPAGSSICSGPLFFHGTRCGPAGQAAGDLLSGCTCWGLQVCSVSSAAQSSTLSCRLLGRSSSRS